MEAARIGPYRIRFTADPVQLIFLRAGLERWLVGLDWPEDERIDAVLAVSEACTNSVRHAYLAGAPGEVEVNGQVMLAGEHRYVVFVVRDHGRWRAEAGGNGLGLPSLRACMDKVKIRHDERGTVVTMISRPVAVGVPQPRPASDGTGAGPRTPHPPARPALRAVPTNR